jgi:hypothetical protein
VALGVGAAGADEFQLMTGVDAGYWPGESRSVSPDPGPCCAGTFFDGDRLAGNAPQGPPVTFQGVGTPLYQPNEAGALSFMFRRGSVPLFGNQFPLQGVDFLGGPLLDLDGDAEDDERSLVPVSGGHPVELPGTQSHVSLTFDLETGVVTLDNFDATGTNEAGPGISAGVATTINVLAGTTTGGRLPPDSSINPEFDTRAGTVTPLNDESGQPTGVFRIENLGYEFWQDTILAGSPTADTLGTFQFLGAFRGWLIVRDPATGEFPILADLNLGSALWPMVDTTGLGVTINTAGGLAGGTALISSGHPQDNFAAPGNGGTGPTDLGAYLDEVVTPRVHSLSDRYVYLESAGFGANNSGDPIYFDSISYDVVIIAQQAPEVDGDHDGDGDVDLLDFSGLTGCFSGGEESLPGPGCAMFDFDFDGDVDLADYAGFESRVTGPR